MTELATAGRYLRTLRTLRPAQVGARLRLRVQRAAFRCAPGIATTLLPRTEVSGCWPADFTPFDGRTMPSGSGPTTAEIAQGRITLLGAMRDLRPAGSGPAKTDWEQGDAPLLWRYHLHYWDWAWTLTRSADGGQIFAELYSSWRQATRVGQGVAWSPYVVSLRAWTLCGLWHPLVRGTPAQDAVRTDLGLHRSFLLRHLETDVGGNHLLKNYKALIGLAVADDDRPDQRRQVDALLAELERQVLGDGGHYERAPAYHCQVLADLDDLASLLRAAGVDVPAALSEAVGRMRGWLAAILGPGRTVPLLNDGYPVPKAAVDDLLGSSTAIAVCGSAPSTGACRLLADSGLAVLHAGPWHLIADVGAPCPDELPAHAHADTLSFLLWVDGRPVLVDSGTSTYEPGPTRDAERGTAAHSTVIVDGLDSTEVWGAFRAGRRARPRLVSANDHPGVFEVTAGHDGYRHLPGRPLHWRTWRVDASGVRLLDRVTGTGWHRIELVLTFAAGVDVTIRPTHPAAAGTPGAASGVEELLVTVGGTERLVVRTDGKGRWRVRRSWRAAGWSRTVPAPTAVLTVEDRLPIQLSTELRSVS